MATCTAGSVREPHSGRAHHPGYSRLPPLLLRGTRRGEPEGAEESSLVSPGIWVGRTGMAAGPQGMPRCSGEGASLPGEEWPWIGKETGPARRPSLIRSGMLRAVRLCTSSRAPCTRTCSTIPWAGTPQALLGPGCWLRVECHWESQHLHLGSPGWQAWVGPPHWETM